MSSPALLATRLEAARNARSDGLIVEVAGAGLEISSDLLGLTVVPRADGRLGFCVIGYPALTGLCGSCSLLRPGAYASFAPSFVQLNGLQLACLHSSDLAPMLHQGFTLTLESSMARFLTRWLPRLARVAELTAPMARRLGAHQCLPPGMQGQDLCAELVSAVLLDGQSVDGALAVLAPCAEDAALPTSEPVLRELLKAVARERASATVTTLRPGADEGRSA